MSPGTEWFVDNAAYQQMDETLALQLPGQAEVPALLQKRPETRSPGSTECAPARETQREAEGCPK